jgi:LPXTG-site transpeptidase (sortase) family protein
MTQKSLSVRFAAQLVTTGRVAYTRKWSFLAIFVFVLFTTTAVAASFDVLPDPTVVKADVPIKAPVLAAASVIALANPELPTKIEIPAINLSVTVSNPTSTDVPVLDNALLTGAVRYPTSSKLGVPGNTIIFGHSSYLPIVMNKAFKTFDGIQNLTKGDRITVTGSGHTYVYSVDTVVKANATADSIPLNVEGSKLTLATCNSFGQKSDRFVVTATLVETDPI